MNNYVYFYVGIFFCVEMANYSHRWQPQEKKKYRCHNLELSFKAFGLIHLYFIKSFQPINWMCGFAAFISLKSLLSETSGMIDTERYSTLLGFNSPPILILFFTRLCPQNIMKFPYMISYLFIILIDGVGGMPKKATRLVKKIIMIRNCWKLKHLHTHHTRRVGEWDS